ncbi:endolytic transglycosylase MltG [Thalassobacillus devorans]|uniref:endolytic transglycosylase MltG n=1 Tax=Thalassobacillus devorans TaxID=279813 RepID=UPI000A1CD8B2|nr:endolytic transglycosylase MltG [Thalassobacillus devorans]
MKHTVRAFSFGLLASSLVYFLVMHFVGFPEEMFLQEETGDATKEGYILIEETELQEMLTNQYELGLKEKQQEAPISNDELAVFSPENNRFTSTTLKIEPGMNSETITEFLEEEGLIINKVNFQQYLDEAGYSRNLQVGQFQLDSEMTYQEIAKLITSN